MRKTRQWIALALVLMLCVSSLPLRVSADKPASDTYEWYTDGYRKIVYQNDFSDSDISGFTKCENAQNAGFAVSGGVLTASGGHVTYTVSLTDGSSAASLTDYVVSVNFKGNAKNIGLTVRSDKSSAYNMSGDIDPYFFYNLGFDGSGRVRLLKRYSNLWRPNTTVNGTSDGVTTAFYSANTTDGWNNLAVRAEGNTLTFYVNGEIAATAVDEADLLFDHGSFGLRCLDSSVVFDDLCVYTMSSDCDTVKQLIVALPDAETVTLADAEKVNAARLAYESLNEDEKDSIGAGLTKKLNDAVSAIAQLQLAADQAAAREVEALIEQIGEVTEYSAAAIEAAENAYAALTEAQKMLVGNYGELAAARAAYNKLTAGLYEKLPVAVGEAVYTFTGEATAPPDAETDAQKALPWPKYFTSSMVYNQAKTNLYWRSEGKSLLSNFGMYSGGDKGVGLFKIPARDALPDSSEWSNYVVTALTRVESANTGNASSPATGLAFRSKDNTSNYYVFELSASGNMYTKAQLRLVQDNTSSVLQQIELEPLPMLGQIYRLTVVADGTEISCYLGGLKLLSVQDDAVLTGTFGVRTLYANTQQVYFDDLAVYRLADGTELEDLPASEILADDADAFTGEGAWQVKASDTAEGGSCQYKENGTGVFEIPVKKSARYTVYYSMPEIAGETKTALEYETGIAYFDVSGMYGVDSWVELGTYEFTKKSGCRIIVSGDGATADAVRLVPAAGVPEERPVDSSAGSVDFTFSYSETKSTGFTGCNPDIQGGVCYYDGYYYYQQCGVNDNITRSIYKGTDMDNMELMGTYKNLCEGYVNTDSSTYYWQWFGNLWIDPDDGLWYTIVHTEFNYGKSDSNNKNHFRKLGFATSTDEGKTWVYGGDIITSDHPVDSSDSFTGDYVDAGAGDPCLYVDTGNGYFYVFYNHVWNKKTSAITGEPGEQTRILSNRVARAPISEHMSPDSWKQWYDPDSDGEGAWDQPGKGGRASDIVSSSELSYPCIVTYSKTRDKYLMVAKGPNFDGDMHLVLYTCDDIEAQNWSEPIDIGSRAGVWSGAWYMFAFDPDTGSQFAVDDSFRIYFHANGYPIYKEIVIGDGSTPCMNYSGYYPESPVDDGNLSYDKYFGSYEYDTAALTPVLSSGTLSKIRSSAAAGGSVDVFGKTAVGDYIEYTLFVRTAGVYDLFVRGVSDADRGSCTLSVNGEAVGKTMEQYSADSVRYTDDLIGRITVSEPGEITVRFTVAGKTEDSREYKLGLDAIRLMRVTAKADIITDGLANGSADIAVSFGEKMNDAICDVYFVQGVKSEADFPIEAAVKVEDLSFTVAKTGEYTLYAVSKYGDSYATVFTVSERQQTYRRGDIDKNGRVNVSDIMTLKALIMNGKWSEEELNLGDMNANGSLEVGDIMTVKNIIMNSAD